MPGRIGISGYVVLMKSLPATAHELARVSGFTSRSVTGMMRRLWALGLAHPGDVLFLEKNSRWNPCPVWMAGDGSKHKDAKCGGKLRPGVQHIAFAYAYRALQDGATTQDVADAMGSSLETGQRFVRLFRDQGMVRIAEWQRGTDHKPVAVFELGQGPDAPKPKQSAAEKSRRCRAAAKRRVLMFHALPPMRMAA